MSYVVQCISFMKIRFQVFHLCKFAFKPKVLSTFLLFLWHLQRRSFMQTRFQDTWTYFVLFISHLQCTSHLELITSIYMPFAVHVLHANLHSRHLELMLFRCHFLFMLFMQIPFSTQLELFPVIYVPSALHFLHEN